jgi:hypothetical protein
MVYVESPLVREQPHNAISRKMLQIIFIDSDSENGYKSHNVATINKKLG